MTYTSRIFEFEILLLWLFCIFQTDNGSALHEAALFGKVEVVRLLLKSGIDIDLEDCQKRTVLDLLNDLNTSIAKQTKKLIRGN